MKLLPMTMLGFATLLAACGQKAATNDATMAGNMSSDMGNMAMPEAARTAKGSGVVKAIDKAAGTITLDHGPIAEAQWPAMTMAFKAAPALLDSVKVGDKVNFALALKDDGGEVTAIGKK
ncbi:copper-binding protein [Sphingobium sp.]|uniref:copper-binding protein n=1 Tax=Sphingobium sp. TaxID=1912891 RepID=UPI0028BD6760|nr:copper-binding protein [Sphingobium sp.]